MPAVLSLCNPGSKENRPEVDSLDISCGPGFGGCVPYQPDPDEGISIFRGQKLIMGSGRFSVYKIYLPFYGRAILTSDRSIHDAGNIRNTFCNSQVFPVNLAVCHHPGEQRRTVSMFGKNQKTGRIPVQTVDAAVDKGFAF
mgnify:CR=1 FL=1